MIDKCKRKGMKDTVIGSLPLSTCQAVVPVIRVAMVIGVTTEEDMGSLVCISIFVNAAS